MTGGPGPRHPFDKRDALVVALLGVAIGTIVLGVGGRISMRAMTRAVRIPA